METIFSDTIFERSDFIDGIDKEVLDFCQLEKFIKENGLANNNNPNNINISESDLQQQLQQREHLQQHQLEQKHNCQQTQKNTSYLNSTLADSISNCGDKCTSYHICTKFNNEHNQNNKNQNKIPTNLESNIFKVKNSYISNKKNLNNNINNDGIFFCSGNIKTKCNNDKYNVLVVSSNAIDTTPKNSRMAATVNRNLKNLQVCNNLINTNTNNNNNNYIKSKDNNNDKIGCNYTNSKACNNYNVKEISITATSTKKKELPDTNIRSNPTHLPESPPDSGSEPFSPSDINSITSGASSISACNAKFQIATKTVHYQKSKYQMQQSLHNSTLSQPLTPGKQVGDLPTATTITSKKNDIPNLDVSQIHINRHHQSHEQHMSLEHQHRLSDNLLLDTTSVSSNTSPVDYNNEPINNSFYNLGSGGDSLQEELPSTILEQQHSVLPQTKSNNVLLPNEYQLLQEQQHMQDLHRSFRNDILGNDNQSIHESSLSHNSHALDDNVMGLVCIDNIDRFINTETGIDSNCSAVTDPVGIYSSNFISTDTSSHTIPNEPSMNITDSHHENVEQQQLTNSCSLHIDNQSNVLVPNNQLSPSLNNFTDRKRKLCNLNSTYQQQQMDGTESKIQNISIIKHKPTMKDSLSPVIQTNSDQFLQVSHDYHTAIAHQSQTSPILISSSVSASFVDITTINSKFSHDARANLSSRMNLQNDQDQQNEDTTQQQNTSDVSDACALQCIRFSAFQQHTWHTLVDQNLQELAIPNFRVDADKGFNFSNSDDAFVCQKKNHFQITCHAQLQGNPVFIKTTNGLEKIKSFHLHFYGVKLEATNQVIRVEQSQSDRSKKPFHPVLVDLKNFFVSKITVGRLHFSETTSNNMRKKGRPNPEQRYFQLVIGLYGHTHSGQFAVVVQASERIIVRASNPGQFESDVELCWQRGFTSDSICHAGRVGINTDRPDESLVIHGNLKVSGHIVQPSDSRAKREIGELDTAEQLRNLQKIRVVKYRYEPEFAIHSGLKKSYGKQNYNKYSTRKNFSNLSNEMNLNNVNNGYSKNDDENKNDYYEDRYDYSDDGSEIIDTGVIAQEVREVLPDAVKEAGSIVLPSGQVIENFLLVNKDRILMENIGAVKELCKVTDSLETRIGQLEKMNLKIIHIQQTDRTQSECSKNSYKYLLNDYYNNKSAADEVCSNTTIQMIIIFLVIIMAICLTAISTLYFLERTKRSYSDNILYNHELLQKKNRVEDRQFNKYYEQNIATTTQSSYMQQLKYQHKKLIVTPITYTDGNYNNNNSSNHRGSITSVSVLGTIFETTPRFKNSTTKYPSTKQKEYYATINNETFFVLSTMIPFAIGKQEIPEQKYFVKQFVEKLLEPKTKFDNNDNNSNSKHNNSNFNDNNSSYSKNNNSNNYDNTINKNYNINKNNVNNIQNNNEYNNNSIGITDNINMNNNYAKKNENIFRTVSDTNNMSSVEVTIPQDVENNSIDSDIIQNQSQKPILIAKPIKIYNKDRDLVKTDSKVIATSTAATNAEYETRKNKTGQIKNTDDSANLYLNNRNDRYITYNINGNIEDHKNESNKNDNNKQSIDNEKNSNNNIKHNINNHKIKKIDNIINEDNNKKNISLIVINHNQELIADEKRNLTNKDKTNNSDLNDHYDNNYNESIADI